MKIRPVTDLSDLQGFFSLQQDSYAHDFDRLPAYPLTTLLPRFAEPQTRSERIERYVGWDGDVPLGLVDVRVPLLDNLSTGHLDVVVHPEHRGRGHGRALLDAGIETLKAHGRSRLFLESATESGERLLLKAGAHLGQHAVRRTLDLTAPLLPPTPVPDGYRLVQYLDGAPDDLADGIAHLQGRMSTDMPLGELETEPELWDAARLREREQNLREENRASITTVAVHVETGYVAGVTDLVVNRQDPACVDQWATIVDPDHRGHRLGVVLKSWNHPYLLEHWPAAEFVNTWNAESNTFMVSVNEALGFQVMERWTEWQLDT